ncbi:MAG: uracil phosphoribosyltransferase [Clostridia bacterium]|nr:uracil phosphoribosyltransferase [Clostridia bacterium]
MSNITIFNHPLISHKVALLRDKNTDTKQFRELVTEITLLMAYEAFRDMPTVEKIVETPLEKCVQRVVTENSIAIIPVLRAGLGMVEGILSHFPMAKVGHIGLYRDHEKLEPREYYCKLPENIDKKVCLIVDPMLATGGSANAAIALLKERNCTHIKLMNIICAPEGINAVHTAHPDVQIYCATMDRELNENGYILPGLGDAGDRIFGTK